MADPAAAGGGGCPGATAAAATSYASEEPAPRGGGHAPAPEGGQGQGQQGGGELVPSTALRRLYVGMLPFTTTDAELNDLFATFGPLEYCKIMTEKDSGRSVRACSALLCR